MAKRPRIGVVGSSNVDLVTYVDRMPVWGETIAAPRFEMSHRRQGGQPGGRRGEARRGGRHGLEGRRRHAGRWRAAEFRELRASTRAHVERVAGQSTGTATILVDKSGDNCILIVKGANGDLHAGGRRARRRRSQGLRPHPAAARGPARDRLRGDRLRQAAWRQDGAQSGAGGSRPRHGARARRELSHAQRDRARHPDRACRSSRKPKSPPRRRPSSDRASRRSS